MRIIILIFICFTIKSIQPMPSKIITNRAYAINIPLAFITTAIYGARQI